MKKLLPIVSLLIFVATLPATIIHVPDEYSTIQGGIDAASEGDTLVFDKNVNLTEFNFHGKRLIIKQFYKQQMSQYSSSIVDIKNRNAAIQETMSRFTNTQITNDDVSSFTSAPYSF